jgi:hypothetical protein
VVDGPLTLVADDDFVYWNDIASLAIGGGRVRAVSRDAQSGTSPATLATVPSGREIESVAVNDRSLYWTPFDVNSTVFTGDLWTGDKSLLNGGNRLAAHQLSSLNAHFVATRGDDVFLVYWPDLWHTRLARLSGDGAPIDLGELKDGAADAMVFVDRWVIISVPAPSCGDKAHRLFAADTSGSGGFTLIADGLVTPMALGPDGLTFINKAQQLVAISTADLTLALTAGP